MTKEDLIGTYNIMGSNQDAEENKYKGTLTLSLDTNNRFLAKWRINNEQEQLGEGFFKNNILVLNFKYIGHDKQTYKGIVVYKCLTKNILEGFWSEEHGNPLFLGEENCFRIQI